MHGFCLQRSWGHFRLEVCRVEGCLAGASPGLSLQQLQGGTAGQCTMEEPPGELGNVGLGLMAQHKAMLGELPIMYTVIGLLSHLRLNNGKEALI